MTSAQKKILYVATSDIHLNTFHLPYLKWLSEAGHIVEIAAEHRGGLNIDGVNRAHWVPFPRKIFSIQNIKTYRRLKCLINMGDYDLIHCHTPIPSALTRLAARRWREKGGKLLYTAHGFHFYRGAPLKNWLFYYPIEWILSAFTDTIITINKEDFGYIEGRMQHGQSFMLPGIGVQTERFRPVTVEEKLNLRRELGYTDADFILLYVAEFIPRKNHRFLIDAVSQLLHQIPNLKLVFVGGGNEKCLRDCQARVVSRNLRNAVHFLGFRSDMSKIAPISDVAVSSSRHEGLGVALLEQMLCETPCLASEDRGHREFVLNGKSGYLFPQEDMKIFQKRVIEMFESHELRCKLGRSARQIAMEFSVEKSLGKMKSIYLSHLAN